MVYLPEVSDLYHENEQVKQFQYNGLDEFMEGKVEGEDILMGITVVEKLFRIINPNTYFGDKRIFNNFKLLNT